MRDYLLKYSCLNEAIINIIIQYNGGFMMTSIYKFKKTKITAIKQLNNNCLVIGFSTGDICIYNLLDRTTITNTLIKNPKKKYISALCPLATKNKIACGLSKTNKILLWDYVTNIVTETNIDNSTYERFIDNIIHIKDNLIICVVQSGDDTFKAHVVNLETSQHIIQFHTKYLNKINNKIIEVRCDNNIYISCIDSFLNDREHLINIIKCSYYENLKKAMPIDEQNYIIAKKDTIIFKNIKECCDEKNYKIMQGDYKDVINVNNRIVVLMDIVNIFDLNGILIQTIEHNNIMLVENLQDGLLIVDDKANIIIYS